jgi:FSR family fosmidomycin resistance protein-like MFS transporter
VLVAAVAISGSTLQPVIGALGGAGRSKAIIVIGMLMMAVLFSSIGFAPNLWVLVPVLIVGALGCSMFHPHAATVAMRMASGRRGLAMSMFTVAGTLGIFLSPKVVPRIATFSSAWGLKSLIVTMPFGLACAAILFLTPMASRAEEVRGGKTAPPERTEWSGLLAGDLPGLATLVVSATLYSLTISGFCSFLPLMLCGERGMTLVQAGDLLAWLMLAGAAGVLIGGYLSDRVGRWWVIMAAYVVAVPLLYGFLATGGAWSKALLIAGGAVLWAAQPCTITLAQELAPQASRIASGMVMGFAWGMAGFFFPIFGMIADRMSMSFSMKLIAFLPLGAAVSLCAMKRFARSRWV